MGGSKSKKSGADGSPSKSKSKKGKKGGGGMDLASIAKAKSAAVSTSKKLDEKDPTRKWQRIRDNLVAEVAESDLAARAVEGQVERLDANISKLEKECKKAYKKLKKLKKALRKVGHEKDDIVEYLEELHVEQENEFEHVEVREGAVDTFVQGKAKAAVKKVKRQNAFLRAFSGGAAKK